MKTSIAKLFCRRQSVAMPEPQNTPGFLDVQKTKALPPEKAEAAAEGRRSAPVPTDFRILKATLPAIEFGCVQWAARRDKRKLPNGGMGALPLAEFLREAVLDKVRAVAKAEIAKGKSIPPDIAAVIDERRKP